MINKYYNNKLQFLRRVGKMSVCRCLYGRMCSESLSLFIHSNRGADRHMGAAMAFHALWTVFNQTYSAKNITVEKVASRLDRYKLIFSFNHEYFYFHMISIFFHIVFYPQKYLDILNRKKKWRPNWRRKKKLWHK